MKRDVIVDAGPLVSFFNKRDRYHQWARKWLAEIEPPLLTCEAVLSEACFLLSHQSDSGIPVLELLERGLLEVSFDLDVEASRTHEIMRRYSNVPASLADACLVRMAELKPGSAVLTLDSDFRIYRLHDRSAISLIAP